MSRAKMLSAKIRSWDLLNENLKDQLEEMPHVQQLQARLDELLGIVRQLDNEQEDARAKLRDVTQRRREVEREGEIIRRRVEAHLRGTYGHTSERLIRFGVKPRPRIIRRKAAEKPPEPTAPTPAAS